MSVHLDFHLRRGTLDMNVDLRMREEETLVIVGPNGAGKSSLLMALAGLVRIDAGRIEMGSALFDGGPHAEFVPPNARKLGVVFQDHRLFPALSVLENIAFGPRARGRSKAEARRSALDWLERVGLEDRAAARPTTLSGGQSQRVALARALASEPAALLLDEPVSAVDASTRIELRRSLKEHLSAFAGPALVVAHDIEDAFALADRIAVMEEGRIIQVGSVDEVVRCPASRYTSDLVGLNFYRGRIAGNQVRVHDFDLVVASDLEGEVTLTIHPRAVSLFLERPQGSPRNSWPARVLGLEPSLGRFRLRLGGALPIVAEVTESAISDLDLREGREIWVTVKATEIAISAR